MAGFTVAEQEFCLQRHEFLAVAKRRYGNAPGGLNEFFSRPAYPLEPVRVGNLAALTAKERSCVAAAYHDGYGVVHVLPECFEYSQGGDHRGHPLLNLAEQLTVDVSIGHAVAHPMENQPEASARSSLPDGTLKLYNLAISPGAGGYREQAQTNEMFDAHNDGLGYAGLIKTSIITLDQPPFWGGYTFFQNLVRLSIAIAADDPDAFETLFLPDAITALRPGGKRAIRVCSPVLFLGRDGEAQVFFRVSSGGYQITWREHPALERARRILHRACMPFSADSRFVNLMQPGETVIIDNRHIVHGRTPFIEGPNGTRRIISRKWFVSNEEDVAYRHVPGIEVDPRYAHIFPGMFTGNAIRGEWKFQASVNRNVRVR
jgi:hypothetical protein